MLADHADACDEDEFETSDYFKVRAMSPNDTPDKRRSRLDTALQELAKKLREHPTLPANPKNPSCHLKQSKSSDCALKLPESHCAFDGCSWTGDNNEQLMLHLQAEHINVLQDSIQALKERQEGVADKNEYDWISSA